MKIYQADEMVTIYGPALDDPTKMVERQVVARDVGAYVNIGYAVGAMPEVEKLRQKVRELTTPPVAAETPSEGKETPAKATRKAKSAK